MPWQSHTNPSSSLRTNKRIEENVTLSQSKGDKRTMDTGLPRYGDIAGFEWLCKVLESRADPFINDLSRFKT